MVAHSPLQLLMCILEALTHISFHGMLSLYFRTIRYETFFFVHCACRSPVAHSFPTSKGEALAIAMIDVRTASNCTCTMYISHNH